MSKVQDEEKLAVDAGYWHLFRFNPAADKKFTLDSKTPTKGYQEFLDGEVRYMSLRKANPDNAEKLYAKSAENAKQRFDYLQKLIDLYAG